jgi:hypothetical protein
MISNIHIVITKVLVGDLMYMLDIDMCLWFKDI